jgi:uracil-DNA glycosylase
MSNRQRIDQTWSIDKIGTEARPPSWEAVFESAKQDLHIISQELDRRERINGMYYPLKADIFAALYDTPLNNIKAVIIGQDPYPQTLIINGTSLPRAVGLAFSVRKEDSIPSSLNNIYIELTNTVDGFVKPDHGDISEWTAQGVLLLNKCLTVQPGQPGSHDDIWGTFINRIFQAISIVNPTCIYMLWGREAQRVKPMLGKHSIILEAAHPSGLSARRGFFGCNHFNLTNEALIKQGKTPIDWRITPINKLRKQQIQRTTQLTIVPFPTTAKTPISIATPFQRSPTTTLPKQTAILTPIPQPITPAITVPQPTPPINMRTIPKPIIPMITVPQPTPPINMRTISKPIIPTITVPQPTPPINMRTIPKPIIPMITVPKLTVPIIQPTIKIPNPTIPIIQPNAQIPTPIVPIPKPTVQIPTPTITIPKPTIPIPQQTVPIPKQTLPIPTPTVQIPTPTIPIIQPLM